MNSLRRWLYRPKRSDTSLLAQFFYADEDLNIVAAELDSFDGRKDPERCTALVNQLRSCQDKVLTAIQNIMDDAVPGRRASRDFRCKFPDDVIQENLSGQLWFGAECLAAGSSIMNREAESASMRPLARALTKNLDSLRTILREQCLKNINEYTDRIKEALIIFDKLFAEFELSYVSAMVPVKTMKEYDTIQEITVLFSETVHRALKISLLTQDMIDEYDPALMFTIPRLAIVSGLVVFRQGPLNPDNDPCNMSDMFRPFQTLLFKIRELLYTLSPEEMTTLERALCSAEEPTFLSALHPTIESVERFSQTEFISKKTNEPSRLTAFPDEDPILSQSPNSGSPATPLGPQDFFVGTMSTSTSCGTVVAQLTDDGANDVESMLNKSESNDSGLNSENLSTTDTVSSMGSQHAQGDRTLTEITREDTLSSLNDDVAGVGSDNIPGMDSKEGVTQRVHAMCAEIVSDIVTSNLTEISSISESCATNNRSTSPTQCTSSSSNQVASASATIYDSREVVCDSPKMICDSRCDDDREFNVGQLDERPCSSVIFIDAVASSPGHDSSASRICQPLQATSSKKKKRLSPRKSTKDDDNRGGKVKSLLRGKKASESVPNSHRMKYHEYVDSLSSSCSSSKSDISSCHGDTHWEKESFASSETSSYNSECQDDEEIALAIHAAEMASRNEARSRFRSSSDMIHRLFVCVSGVADQLQTNFASDLRNILRSVFDMNCTEPLVAEDDDLGVEDEEYGGASSSNENSPTRTRSNAQSIMGSGRNTLQETGQSQPRNARDPPRWVPDELSPLCMSCRIPFTFVRRRHHCRNCGKIFCGRCSSNYVSLPHFGHAKPVRVCNRCFMFQVTPFTVAGTIS